MDLDKSWDGLSACLDICRPAWADFLKAGVPIGKVEVGYGPALCHRSAVVSPVAEAALSVEEPELLEALQFADLHRRYPRALWKRGNDDAVRYLVDNFSQLQDFFRHVRNHTLGVIVQFT